MRQLLVAASTLLLLCGTALAQAIDASAAAPTAQGFIDPAGPIAAAQLEHFGTITTVMMLIVVIPIFLVVPLILWRYRRGGKGKYRPDWEFNWGVESAIWGIPIAIIVVLGVALWKHTHTYDPYRPLGNDPLVIDVISLDWKFAFLYPEQGVATVDYLALPQDRPVTLRLTSGTVMQSFMVPQLAGQIYTMAGMMTQLNLIADRSGQYLGRNTQYNGNGFATQTFRTVVMPPAEFAAWAERTRNAPDSMTWATYEALLAPSIVREPQFYGQLEAGLFDRVIGSFAPAMTHTPATTTPTTGTAAPDAAGPQRHHHVTTGAQP